MTRQKQLPLCVQSMGCYCACHAAGLDSSEPCDTSEERARAIGRPPEPRTKVIFRKFRKGGDIIAVFPEIPGTHKPETCSSYQQVGQHGACSMAFLRSHATIPAKPEEFEPLRRELESLGYRLKLCTKITDSMHKARLRALRGLD